MSRTTLRNVNAALLRAGLRAELVRGAGYFYFAGPDMERAHTTSVMTPRLGSMTVEQWVEECRRLAPPAAQCSLCHAYTRDGAPATGRTWQRVGVTHLCAACRAKEPQAPLGTHTDKPEVRAARLAKAAKLCAVLRHLPATLGEPRTPSQIARALDGAGRAAVHQLAGVRNASDDTWLRYVVPMLELEERPLADPFAGLPR